jgi:hypothetical protein
MEMAIDRAKQMGEKSPKFPPTEKIRELSGRVKKHACKREERSPQEWKEKRQRPCVAAPESSDRLPKNPRNRAEGGAKRNPNFF